MATKLYRSATDKMLGGVCGGLGRYLGIDSTLVRIFFVLLAVAGGGGVLIYFLLWILVPAEGTGAAWQPTYGETPAGESSAQPGAGTLSERMHEMGEDIQQAVNRPNQQAVVIIGGVLIFVGCIFLVQNLDISWLDWFDFDLLWPVMIIVVGAVMIWRYVRER